jgi:hypothetical protein
VAVPLLQQSLKEEARPGAAVMTWLWLALAQQKLGKPAEARHWQTFRRWGCTTGWRLEVLAEIQANEARR